MKFFVPLFSLSMLLCACDTATDVENADVSVTDTVEQSTIQEEKLQNGDIKLVPFTDSESFSGSSLEIEGLEEKGTVNSTSPVFQFKVNDFELGGQTPIPGNIKLANSGMGQHIHVIVDNEPYTAHYHDTAKRTLNEGGHVLLAFLSRSYHESVKNDDSYVLRSFNVGNSTESLSFDPDGTHLFYSRPKGTYKGEETENLLFDFFLVNGSLGNDHQVELTIDGKDFLITKWQPYLVNGLGKGQHTFRIRLMKDGQFVQGPFNDSGERTVTLE